MSANVYKPSFSNKHVRLKLLQDILVVRNAVCHLSERE